MKSFKNPKALYRKICKGLKVDRKLRLGGLVRTLDYMDFDGREMCYLNRRTGKYLEIYHIDRMRDYTEMYGVFITDKDKAFLDGYGCEQKGTDSYKLLKKKIES